MGMNALLKAENSPFYSSENPRVKGERIDGVEYMMSPSAYYRHGLVTSNLGLAIKQSLGEGPCRVFIDCIDLKYHANDKDKKLRDDYVIPDIVIVCEQELLRGGAYYGTPKFIAEVLSPSSKRHDKVTKMKIYQDLGVSEYWTVSPTGDLDVYYLENDHYEIERTMLLSSDEYDDDYNADEIITLRCFPQVKIRFGDIFKW